MYLIGKLTVSSFKIIRLTPTPQRIIKEPMTCILKNCRLEQQVLNNMFSGINNYSNVTSNQIGMTLDGQNRKNA